jgi:hypothetical protein
LPLANGGGGTQHGLPPGGSSSSNSPPSTPGINAAVSSLPQQSPHSPAKEQTSPGANLNGGGFRAVAAREFFPTDTPEPNTSMSHSAVTFMPTVRKYLEYSILEVLIYFANFMQSETEQVGLSTNLGKLYSGST